MTAHQQQRVISRQKLVIARYGLEWAAELAEYLIRLGCWQAGRRVSGDPFYDDKFMRELKRGSRTTMLQLAEYVRAVRPERN